MDEKTLELEVAVQDDLQYDTLLGLDVPFIWKLGDRLSRNDQVMAVHTRNQTRKHHARQRSYAKLNASSEITLTPLNPADDDHQKADSRDDSSQSNGIRNLPDFADDLFSQTNIGDKQTRSRNRDVQSMFSSAGDILHPLDGGAKKLQSAQATDPYLRIIRQQADLPGSSFITDKGLVY